MVELVPETAYVLVDGASVAYQVVGSGPFDLVFTGGSFNHVDIWWEDPTTTRLIRRLASFSRLIVFDRRGTGASDPLPGGTLPAAAGR